MKRILKRQLKKGAVLSCSLPEACLPKKCKEKRFYIEEIRQETVSQRDWKRVMKREGRWGRDGRVFERGAAPSGNVRRSFDGVRKGANKTDNPKPRKGKGNKEGRREKPCNTESKGGTFWESIGFRLCQSHHFLLGFAKAQRRGQEGGGEGGTLSVCAFSQKRLNWGWNWNRVRLVKAVQSLALLHSLCFLFKEAIL